MLKNKNGYTVMELVVVMFAMSVITATIAPFIRLNVDSYIELSENKINLQTARIGFNKMLSELRYLNDLEGADSDHIKFDARIDEEQVNNIHYRLGTDDDGNQGVGRAQGMSFAYEEDYDPLIAGVRTFTITYYDAAGIATTDPNDVHRIRIYMVLQHEGKSLSFIGQVCRYKI